METAQQNMEAITSTDFNFEGQKNVYHGKVRDVYNVNDDLMVMIVSDRISALEFASGASRVAVNSVTMSSDKIVVEYEIAAGSSGYDARMLFTAKGPGITDLDVSVST